MCKNYITFTKHYKKHKKVDEALVLPPAEDIYQGKTNRISENPTPTKFPKTDIDGQCDNHLQTAYQTLSTPRATDCDNVMVFTYYALMGALQRTLDPSTGVKERGPFQHQTEIYTNSIWLGQKDTNNTAEFL